MVYCVHVEQPVPFEKVPSTFYRELKSKHDEKKTKLEKRMKENGNQKKDIQVTCVYIWMEGVCGYICICIVCMAIVSRMASYWLPLFPDSSLFFAAP